MESSSRSLSDDGTLLITSGPEFKYCKVTNFRTVPIFVLSTSNWFVRTIFVLSRVCEENDVEIQWLQSKKKFSYDIKFRTFSKV